MKYLIIIPVYNEEQNIIRLIKSLKNNKYDFLIINDSSTDSTEQILKQENVKYINNIFNINYSKTIQTGIIYAYMNNYDYVIQMDGDGQHPVSELIKIINAMKKNRTDIVIGSRYICKTSYNCPITRRIGTKIFEIIIKLFCHQTIKDPLSGFQMINRDVIKEYALMENYPEFPDANLLIEMIKKGYTISEVAVEMKSREAGESMHGGIIKPVKYMINMFYEIFFILITTPINKKKVTK